MKNNLGHMVHGTRKRPFFPLGFPRESTGMALFITVLLFAALAGVFASPSRRGRTTSFPSMQSASLDRPGHVESNFQRAQDARSLAIAYYAKKYGDRDVSVEVRPGNSHTEVALIRKKGLLVKKLFIRGNRVREVHTGLRDWIFDLLTNVN